MKKFTNIAGRTVLLSGTSGSRHYVLTVSDGEYATYRVVRDEDGLLALEFGQYFGPNFLKAEHNLAQRTSAAQVWVA